MAAFNFVSNHWATIATILFLLSELIGETRSIQSNSVFGFMIDFLRGEVKKANTLTEVK